MKKDFKKDLLSIYALIFGIFMFFSSVKCMFDLLHNIPFIPEPLLITGVIALHIGTLLLILSGRLKDKD